MLRAGLGLTEIPTAVLEGLLLRIHKGELMCPLSADVLACLGLQDRTEALMSALRGVDAQGMRALLVCVLAERRRHSRS